MEDFPHCGKREGTRAGTRLLRHLDNRSTIASASWLDRPRLSDRVSNETVLHLIKCKLTRRPV